MQRKRIPIGYEDIREIMDQDMYFVDKSMPGNTWQRDIQK